MREIKFRIYFETDDEDETAFMSEPIILEDLLFEDWIEFENSERTVSLPINDFRFFYKRNDDNYKIMQYTGLKDKNGKEIYEGDIIKCADCIFKVYFEDGMFQIEVVKVLSGYVGTQKGMNYTLDFILACEEDEDDAAEIIGNIYENGELLEGE